MHRSSRLIVCECDVGLFLQNDGLMPYWEQAASVFKVAKQYYDDIGSTGQGLEMFWRIVHDFLSDMHHLEF